MCNFGKDLIPRFVLGASFARKHPPLHSLLDFRTHTHINTHTRSSLFLRGLDDCANTSKCHEVKKEKEKRKTEKIKRKGASSPPVLITLPQVAS